MEKQLKTMVVIILVITAVTLVLLWLHDQRKQQSGDTVSYAPASRTVQQAPASAAGQGACVIGPMRNSGVEKLGQGVINNADNVCDAATQGCGVCWDTCTPYKKIVDNYGCTDDYSDDDWCNPNANPPSLDPDCDADGDGYPPPEDCDDTDAFTFPGATEICFDGVNNGCDNLGIDEANPQCTPDGKCDGRIESFVNVDCKPLTGSCPLFDVRVINDLKSTLFMEAPPVPPVRRVSNSLCSFLGWTSPTAPLTQFVHTLGSAHYGQTIIFDSRFTKSWGPENNSITELPATQAEWDECKRVVMELCN